MGRSWRATYVNESDHAGRAGPGHGSIDRALRPRPPTDNSPLVEGESTRHARAEPAAGRRSTGDLTTPPASTPAPLVASRRNATRRFRAAPLLRSLGVLDQRDPPPQALGAGAVPSLLSERNLHAQPREQGPPPSLCRCRVHR